MVTKVTRGPRGRHTDSQQLPLLGTRPVPCSGRGGGEAPRGPLPAEASKPGHVQLPGVSLLGLCTLLSDHGDPRDLGDPLSNWGDCGQD